MANGIETRFYADAGSLVLFKKDKDEVIGYVTKFDDKSVWLSQESIFNEIPLKLFLRERKYNLGDFDSYNVLSLRKW